MSHVFISYAHIDGDFVATVIRNIEGAGFDSWIDSEQLRAGSDWRTAIDEAIRNSIAVVVVLSPDARASEYVTYEWSCAWGMGVKVIPIMFRTTEVHPRLSALQHLDFTNIYSRPWAKLIDELKQIDTIAKGILPISRNTPRFVQQAVDALDSYSADVRKGGIETLSQANDPAATEALILAAQHPVKDVRVQAGLALANIEDFRDPRALTGLLDAYNDSNKEIKLKIIGILAEIKDTAATQKMINALTEEDPTIRSVAAISLGYKNESSALAPLVAAMHDIDATVREWAADALGNLGISDQRAIAELLRALHDVEDDSMRANAACALGKIGTSDVAPELRNALSDESDQVQAKTLEALGKLKDLESIPKFLSALADENPDLRAAAIEALRKVQYAYAVPELVKALSDSFLNVRRIAAIALGDIGDSTAVEQLTITLNDPESFMRSSAAEALGKLKDAKAIPYLVAALRVERVYHAKHKMIRALRAFGTPKALAAVEQFGGK